MSNRVLEQASLVAINSYEGTLSQARFAAALRRSRYRHDLAAFCAISVTCIKQVIFSGIYLST